MYREIRIERHSNSCFTVEYYTAERLSPVKTVEYYPWSEQDFGNVTASLLATGYYYAGYLFGACVYRQSYSQPLPPPEPLPR